MRKSILTKLCLPLAFTLASQVPLPASASTVGTVLTVASSVLAYCQVTGSSIPFGNYSGSQVDQSANISVWCTFGTTYNIGMDAGGGSGATTTVRKMTGLGGGTLNYALYRNSSRTSLWGSTVGTDTLSGTGSGLFQSVTVYGRIPASQTAQADTYTDTVTITLTY